MEKGNTRYEKFDKWGERISNWKEVISLFILFGSFIFKYNDYLFLGIFCLSLVALIYYLIVNKAKISQKRRNLLFLGTLMVISFSIFFYVNIYPGEKATKCNEISDNYSVIISNFTPDTINPFTNKVTNQTKSVMLDFDSVEIKRHYKSIVFQSDFETNSSRVFAQNCSKKGILVFGNRNIKEKVFDCIVFLKDLEIFTNSKHKLIYIQNPSDFKFSVDYHAQIISQFIYSIFTIHENNYSEGIDLLLDIESKYEDNFNHKFISQLNTLIALCYIEVELPKQALKHANIALSFDGHRQKLKDLKSYIVNNYPELKSSKKKNQKKETDLDQNEIDTTLDMLNPNSPITDVYISDTIISNPIVSTQSTKSRDTIYNIDKIDITKKDEFKLGLGYSKFLNPESNKFGVTIKGVKIIKPLFDDIQILRIINRTFFAVKKQNQWGILDVEGKLLQAYKFNYSDKEKLLKRFKNDLMEQANYSN